jgi:alkylation response protein AidB-like acyl-CoA dehydrogenase
LTNKFLAMIAAAPRYHRDDPDADGTSFREEVRGFLSAELPEAMRERTRAMTSVYAPPDLSGAWQSILHRRGWAAPAWPVEWGGCGWSPAQRYIFASELARADAPPLSPMGLGMLGPILIAHGSPEQKAYFLPRLLSGEDFWCQGYSEPQAGSDLAALAMEALPRGDTFVCTGQKTWTTHGHAANWIFCLVRTSAAERPQEGVSFLLIDLTSPGVTIRPILSLTGEHIQNEIFFDQVVVPRSNIVGRVGEGWTVAKHLMEMERGGRAAAPTLRRRLSQLRNRARGVLPPGRIADVEVEIDSLEALELRALARGDRLGLDASILKILATETAQHVTELGLEVAGLAAQPWQLQRLTPGGATPTFHAAACLERDEADWARPLGLRYFNERAGSIYGGTNEIQHNILAKALIGR